VKKSTSIQNYNRYVTRNVEYSTETSSQRPIRLDSTGQFSWVW